MAPIVCAARPQSTSLVVDAIYPSASSLDRSVHHAIRTIPAYHDERRPCSPDTDLQPTGRFSIAFFACRSCYVIRQQYTFYVSRPIAMIFALFSCRFPIFSLFSHSIFAI